MKKNKPGSIEFGKRLREFRVAAHLTVRQIATALDVSPATYREWERGRAITGQPYVKLSQILSVSLSGIFGVDQGSRQHLIGLVDQAQKTLEQLKDSL